MHEADRTQRRETRTYVFVLGQTRKSTQVFAMGFSQGASGVERLTTYGEGIIHLYFPSGATALVKGGPEISCDLVVGPKQTTTATSLIARRSNRNSSAQALMMRTMAMVRSHLRLNMNDYFAEIAPSDRLHLTLRF